MNDDDVIDLKVLPKYYEAQVRGYKNFEIRKNDRNFKVGQHLKLREWDKDIGYTGRSVLVKITYITDYAQQDGYVVLGTTKTRIYLVSGAIDMPKMSGSGEWVGNIADGPTDKRYSSENGMRVAKLGDNYIESYETTSTLLFQTISKINLTKSLDKAKFFNHTNLSRNIHDQFGRMGVKFCRITVDQEEN